MANELQEDVREGIERAFMRDPGDVAGHEVTTVTSSQLEQVPFGAQKVAVYRDEGRVLQKLKSFAAELGTDFYYQWETKNKDGTKGVVEGPSIDCALYTVRVFGNCDVDVRVQDVGTHWIFYARFTDFETGFRLSRAYQQRKDQKTGIKDAARQLDIVFQIGQSKAIRNVICNALRPFTDYAFDQAKQGLVEQIGRRLPHYREKMPARLKELEIPLERVERVRGKKLDQWVAADFAKTIAEIKSITDGMITDEELYPPTDVGENRPTRTDTPQTQQTGGASTPAADAATQTAQPKDDKLDPIWNDLLKAIEMSKTVDQATLDQLDDQIVRQLEAAKAPEDWNSQWNRAYAARSKALKEMPAAVVKSDLEVYLEQAYGDLAKCSAIELPTLQERVENELAGDEKRLGKWQDDCVKRSRELRRGKNR